MVVKHIGKEKIFLLFFLTFLIAFFVYIYRTVAISEEKIFQKIEDTKIEEYREIFQNFNTHIINKYHLKSREDILKMLSNADKRHACNSSLSLINTKNTKYLYILQKDNKNRFRFLLDASKEDKANFYQKSDVDDIAYSEIYRTKRASYQTKRYRVTISYLSLSINHRWRDYSTNKCGYRYKDKE